MEKNTPPPAAARPAPPTMLERTISIEEPKTLSESELAFFREAALKVINNNTPEEATRIFLGRVETSAAAAQVEPAAKADN